ncbi:glycosyltransferase family 4 protein [uncultured Candidatus Kuenenia sp.]|uniref:glycosyltransferase family 4 protein n=1 Tax=uncultured Candidatus Kuenenia sp. TaxID=1048336 RepID=UPI0025D2228C|nr:glycosyltransferase family 4 protein [uncultured Candidatus Kuenenia sp.]
MKILWFPRLQFDIDKLHITTWREMCKEIKNLGHYVEIAIAGKQNNEEIFTGKYISIPIIRIKFFRSLSFWINGFLKFIISYHKFNPDIVILNLYTIWFSLLLMFLPQKKRPLIIVDNRTPFYNSASDDTIKINDRIMRSFTRLCYWYCRKFLDGMTVITEHYKQQVCKDFKFDVSAIGVWGSGVDIERFSPLKYTNKDAPFFLKDKFVLMQHGGITYNRGLLETVEALSMIEREDVCLVLIGTAIAGSKAKDDILQLIKKFKLEKNVFVLPPVPHAEIPMYISYCDCAIMAYPNIEYWNNNNPIKLLEYLAMGKVVMCTDMWTFRKVAGNKNCAYYLKDNSPESIAQAINVCYQNRESLQEWGKEGIEVIKENYTWRKQAQRLLDFIVKLQQRENNIL